MQPHSLLTLQKRAAARSAHCHVLARLRIADGYLGTAKFYQFEAARWHVRACEYREEINAKAGAYWHMKERLRILNVVIANPIDATYAWLDEIGRTPGFLPSITGSKPMPKPQFFAFEGNGIGIVGERP